MPKIIADESWRFFDEYGYVRLGKLVPGEQIKGLQQRIDDIMHIEMDAGEVTLFDNFTLHASDVNRSDHPRRAFSVCYMDAVTAHGHGAQYTRVFGPGALTVQQLESQGLP